SFESYTFGLAIAYLAMIIVGGIGSVLGSVLGAVFITLLPYLLDQMFVIADLKFRPNILAGIHQIVFVTLIVAFLLFEPRGVAATGRRVPAAVWNWPVQYRSVSRAAR